MDQNSTADDKQKSLLDFLVSRKLISTETATEILTEVETSGKSVNDIISEKNLINIEDFTRTKAEFFHFTYIDLSDRQIDEQTLNLVPMSIAEHYKLIAFEKIDNHIHVGLVDSNNFKAIEAMDFLAQKHKLKVDYFLISNLS
ncbi:MAG TPA: hypothetical protein PK720_04095, partial [bacterium]|nr:hypothetical protein [bacterium]